MSSIIKAIHTEEIRESRGRPTISVTVVTDGAPGTFQVPVGASISRAEAPESRDPDGHMNAALKNIHDILTPALLGKDAADQRHVDDTLRALDNTSRDARLGTNALIGVSVACAKAAAAAQSKPVYAHLRTLATIAPSRAVPFLFCDFIRGGRYSRSPVAFQEHMLVPQTDSIAEAIAMLEKTQDILHRIIMETFGPDVAETMADDGGYELSEAAYEPPFQLLEQAIRGAEMQERMRIAVDAAATLFYIDGQYRVGGRELSSERLLALYGELAHKYRILCIEDPFADSDAASFFPLQTMLPEVILAGDDITVTDAARIRAHAKTGDIRAVIIKPDQIGTLSEALDAMSAARACGLECIINHRSAETMDDFIADLAFAFGAYGLKAGSLRRPERRVKYERLRLIAA